MSRFALDPATLVWLPPTMAPCSTSTRDGYLEHPASAFADLRGAGVAKVVCEEKHMGSRAVVRVSRSGIGDAVWTRTGRPFFGPELDGPLLARVRAAAGPLFDELDTDWLLLDTELLPWSAKAGSLIRDQYASVGAAGRAALPAALSVLGDAAARGLDVSALRDRLELRSSEIAGYSAAYRAYVRPTDGLAGVTLAPFAVLAGAGVSYADRDHGWHLALADRLAAADPSLFTPTRRMIVDLADPTAEAAATDWWLALTAAGGEGMVVKPYDGLAVKNE
jgi:hypothetical protein